MAAEETAAEAWKRIFGSQFDMTRDQCMFFLNGWNAAKGKA